MKIAVVANMRVPTEKTHGFQTMRMCEAWSVLGHEVTLYVPRVPNSVQEDAFSYYDIKSIFTLTYVDCYSWIRFARFLKQAAFFLQSYSFLKALARKERFAPGTVVFSRNPEVIRYFSTRGYSSFWNAHTLPRKKWMLKQCLKNADGIVCNSAGTKHSLEWLPLPSVVVRNGTDTNQYVGKDARTLRRELSLPESTKVVLYAGHLYAWKGVNTILDAAAIDAATTYVLVGGTPKDVAAYRAHVRERKLENVVISGHQKKEYIPQYLAAADVLLIPNSAHSEESVHHTSPLKMFEYMASGIPIIASDLPSLREVLSDENAYFVPPDDAPALVEKIRYVFSHGHEARNKAQLALIDSGECSWERQAKIAADFMSER